MKAATPSMTHVIITSLALIGVVVLAARGQIPSAAAAPTILAIVGLPLGRGHTPVEPSGTVCPFAVQPGQGEQKSGV